MGCGWVAKLAGSVRHYDRRAQRTGFSFARSFVTIDFDWRSLSLSLPLHGVIVRLCRLGERSGEICVLQFIKGK